MRDHAAAAYPNECVGVLLGDWDHATDVRTVREVRSLANVSDQPQRGYRVDPRAVMELMRAERPGAVVLGFYHSHPDCPARPSETDRRDAAPDFSYVILSVYAGTPVETNGWVFRIETDGFVREAIAESAPTAGRDARPTDKPFSA